MLSITTSVIAYDSLLPKSPFDILNELCPAIYLILYKYNTSTFLLSLFNLLIYCSYQLPVYIYVIY